MREAILASNWTSWQVRRTMLRMSCCGQCRSRGCTVMLPNTLRDPADILLNTPHTSREAALADGAQTFFTGVPCVYGHLSDRFAGDGACVECAAQKKPSASVWKTIPVCLLQDIAMCERCSRREICTRENSDNAAARAVQYWKDWPGYLTESKARALGMRLYKPFAPCIHCGWRSWRVRKGNRCLMCGE